jgi:hypothetical protein
LANTTPTQNNNDSNATRFLSSDALQALTDAVSQQDRNEEKIDANEAIEEIAVLSTN